MRLRWRTFWLVYSYEIHFSGNANYSPSGLMEKLIASARSGSVVNVGAVIDATGEDYFLHDIKYVTTDCVRISSVD